MVGGRGSKVRVEVLSGMTGMLLLWSQERSLKAQAARSAIEMDK